MKILSSNILDEIWQTIPNRPPEVGGILGGRQDVVTHFLPDKGAPNIHLCSYTPDTVYLNQKIAEWAENRIAFMGMFHVHFGGAKTLSEGDKAYIRRIMKAVPEEAGCLFFPIFVMPERKVVVYKAVRMNKEITIIKDEIETQGGIEHEEL